jgi:hypothetical protein
MHEPPQSMSVSLPSRTPSLQDRADADTVNETGLDAIPLTTTAREYVPAGMDGTVNENDPLGTATPSELKP